MARRQHLFCLLPHLLVLVTMYYLPYTGFLSLVKHFYFVFLRKAILQNSNISNMHVWRGELLTKGIYAGNITHKNYSSKGKIYATLFLPSEITVLTENLFSWAGGKDSYEQLGVTGTTPAAAFCSSPLGAQRQTTEKGRKGKEQPDILCSYCDSLGLLFSICCDL